MRRSLVCGSGCGEAYYGEWLSTPPDCQDPCCGDQWVGGATPCRPFCWEPGTILGGLCGGLYGGRFCSGAESSAPCCCEDICDCGGDCIDDGYFSSEIIVDDGGCGSGGCGAGGCASSKSRSGAQSTRMAKAIPATDRMTRSASHRQMIDARANRIRR